ncbi:LpxI family protein [Phyllobacterium zundukense]|uniref:UDP-2,3-diacylglucosamine diphosphatase LpxI n=1 Tax=Phyllobacterium zundukense TaxID=1867719 RepID=A0ACD4D397_9HYPH|nr:UDP-2,3-diacylglucosamine diphosphatase LpxI [Phyllobacterium zundukense]UXN60239.1 UDP-2,3-diacylglucosamine diphosphatase LpxI [Phyllobacterium zundukense]
MTTTAKTPPSTALHPPIAGRTAIVAGNGQLPVAVATSLRKLGGNPLIVAIKGEAEPELYAGEHAEISIVELGGLVKILRAEGISNVVLAGGIRHRPEFRAALRPGNGNLVALYRFLRAFRLGDDGLLRAVIATIESYGFRVLGAHEIVPDILAPAPGTLTRKRADQESVANMNAARQAAIMIGSLDIGQAAIAIGRRVIALEGVEGTDAMLQRVAELRHAKRINRKGGVLVKCAKPQQEVRADLPAIGVSTVENAVKAGLKGIAIEARRTLILGYGETVAAADKAGLFIETFEQESSS